jgi:hypothetical protein
VFKDEIFVLDARVKPKKRIIRVIESEIFAIFLICDDALMFLNQTLFIETENRIKT